MNREMLELVSEFKYLGCVIDKRGGRNYESVCEK